MNERIEDLMREADDVEIPVDEYFLDSDFLSDIDPRRVKVFAELIVKECADIADNQEDYLTAKIIKQQFGVE